MASHCLLLHLFLSVHLSGKHIHTVQEFETNSEHYSVLKLLRNSATGTEAKQATDGEQSEEPTEEQAYSKVKHRASSLLGHAALIKEAHPST